MNLQPELFLQLKGGGRPIHSSSLALMKLKKTQERKHLLDYHTNDSLLDQLNNYSSHTSSPAANHSISNNSPDVAAKCPMVTMLV